MSKPVKVAGAKSVAPRLRFPEFSQGEAWSIKLLGDVAHFYKGKGLSKAEMTPEGKTACIHYGELFTEYGEVIDHVRRRTNLSNGVVVSEVNDVLMPTSDVTPRGLAKASCIRLDGVILSGDTLIVRPNTRKTSGEFLARYIRHREPAVLRLVSGSTVFHLYPAAIAKLQLAYPEHAEQQKIAVCLSSLDDLIAAHADKLAALKQHKQGLLEQLFPREGETVPRLRFPEFENTDEWIEKPLDDIAEISSGGTPNRGSPEYWGGVIPWVTTSLIDFNEICHTTESITEAGLRNSSAKIFPARTILMAMYGQGKTRGKVAMLGIEAATNQACAAITFTGNVEPVFGFYSLALRYDDLRTISNDGSQKNLSAGLIKQIRLNLPSVLEQQKIANCLSTLDALIAAESDRLTALKQHKQGLLQQLFPAMDKATA